MMSSLILVAPILTNKEGWGHQNYRYGDKEPGQSRDKSRIAHYTKRHRLLVE